MSEVSMVELLEAVRQFMREEVLPELDSFKAYNTRVAANNLAIVARQIERQEELDLLDQQLAASLGLQDIENLGQHLSLRIKSGDLPVNQGLIEHLKKRTLLKLAIDNPKYSGYQQALKQWANRDEHE